MEGTARDFAGKRTAGAVIRNIRKVNTLHRVAHQDCRPGRWSRLDNPVEVRGLARSCKCRSLYPWSDPVTGETREGGIQAQKQTLPNA